MATSSFNKDFTLNTIKAVESFTRIISIPAKSIKTNKDLLSPEKQRQAENRVRHMLSC